MKYRLYYQEIEIGVVVENDSNFPNVYGDLHLTINELPISINRYIKYSKELKRVLEKNDENEINKYIEDHERDFFELINSNSWFLIDENNKKENILIPIFDNNKLIWRWRI
jgi:hypothetical protein